MSGARGMIGGATPSERATRLAGTLAELSQTRLVLHVGGAEVAQRRFPSVLPGALVRDGAESAGDLFDVGVGHRFIEREGDAVGVSFH